MHRIIKSSIFSAHHLHELKKGFLIVIKHALLIALSLFGFSSMASSLEDHLITSAEDFAEDLESKISKDNAEVVESFLDGEDAYVTVLANGDHHCFVTLFDQQGQIETWLRLNGKSCSEI